MHVHVLSGPAQQGVAPLIVASRLLRYQYTLDVGGSFAVTISKHGVPTIPVMLVCDLGIH